MTRSWNPALRVTGMKEKVVVPAFSVRWNGFGDRPRPWMFASLRKSSWDRGIVTLAVCVMNGVVARTTL